MFCSSKLDVWMVFCVIFVFGTLLEFTLLIFLQKQVFATRLQRSLTAISMVRSQARAGSITSGSGSGIGSSGITGAAMMGGMAGLMGGMGGSLGLGMAAAGSTPRNDIVENDSNLNGGNERIQLTAMGDVKSGRAAATQPLGMQNIIVIEIAFNEKFIILITFSLKLYEIVCDIIFMLVPQ